MTQEEINCLLQRPKDDAAKAYAEAEAETYSQRLDYVKARAEAEAKTEACEEKFFAEVRRIAEDYLPDSAEDAMLAITEMRQALETCLSIFEKDR